MYVPLKFNVDKAASWNAVRDAGAGMLVTQGKLGLQSVFTPVIVSDDQTVLTAHVARANPWWKEAINGEEVLALFVAASSYVSPSGYPSRHEKPEVVPTWNYVAVEVRGILHVHDDYDWVFSQAKDLTAQFEESRDVPWRLAESDENYVEKLARGIVGIEITVRAITGKYKLSQNRPDEDRENVMRSLEEGGMRDQVTARYMRDSL